MDVIHTLTTLVPSPLFGGCVDYERPILNEDGSGTGEFVPVSDEDVRTQYEALRWEDERPKPTWEQLEAAWPAAQLTMVPLNQRLEQAFMAMLPAHLGQPYMTNDVIRHIGQAKLVVTEYNRLEQYALAAGTILSLDLPTEMIADRDALLALYPQ